MNAAIDARDRDELTAMFMCDDLLTAGPLDLQDLAAACWPRDDNRNYLPQWLATARSNGLPAQMSGIRRRDGTLVAMAACIESAMSKAVYELAWVATHPGWRHRHLGTTLIVRLSAWCRSTRPLVTEPWLFLASDVGGFYAQIGFDRIHSHRDGSAIYGAKAIDVCGNALPASMLSIRLRDDIKGRSVAQLAKEAANPNFSG